MKPKLVHHSWLIPIGLILLVSCTSEDPFPQARLTLPVRNTVELAGFENDYEVMIKIELVNGEDVVEVRGDIRSGHTVVDTLAVLAQPPFEWTWMAEHVENGNYTLLFRMLDTHGNIRSSIHVITVSTYYSLDFSNYTDFPATLFIGDEIVQCDSNASSELVIVKGGSQTISINIQDHLPLPFFDAEEIRIRDNTRMDLYESPNSGSFYYTVSP